MKLSSKNAAGLGPGGNSWVSTAHPVPYSDCRAPHFGFASLDWHVAGAQEMFPELAVRREHSTTKGLPPCFAGGVHR